MNELNIKEWNIADSIIQRNEIISDDNKLQTHITDMELLYDDNSKIVCCGIKKHLLIKRLLLPLVPGGISVLIIFKDVRNSFIYFPLIIFVSSVVLFMNFPILVVHIKLRPVYYGNDLFLDREKLPYLQISKREKKALLNNIKWLLILLFSLLSAALSDYWLFKTQASSSYFEILGVTGGIFKVFQLLAHIGAGFFLSRSRKRVFNTVYSCEEKIFVSSGNFLIN